MERLDKILANLGYGTRKEVKQLVKNGNVKVDGEIIKKSDIKIDPEKNEIEIYGEKVSFKKYVYLMMNKPQGVISATVDDCDTTVIDLLEEEDRAFNPFPVGRLDKDTVGLLLITNDGNLNHRLISPKNHVDKVYYAEIDKEVDEEDIKAFKEGVILDDGYKCMSANLQIVDSSNDLSKVYVTIHEGKFHQVKRMFESRNKKVKFLKRIKFGPISLDDSIQEGEYRELTDEELEILLKV